MPFVEGLIFNGETTAAQVVELIARVKASGSGDVYYLPKLRELRMAHYAPAVGRTRARGVFVQIASSAKGATIVRRVGHTGGLARVHLEGADLEQVIANVKSWRDQSASRLKKHEKVEPNPPGTVSGGHFESDRDKH